MLTDSRMVTILIKIITKCLFIFIQRHCSYPEAHMYAIFLDVEMALIFKEKF